MDKGCVITAAIMAALCLAIAGSIVLVVRGWDEKKLQRANADPESTQSAPVARIPWSELDAIYRIEAGTPSLTTEDDNSKVAADLKKESAWANYKGKVVEWEGEVVAVRQGFNGQSLSIKMNDSTTTVDIVLSLEKSEKAKAQALKKGDRLKFRGRLMSWGSMVKFAMDQGEILD